MALTKIGTTGISNNLDVPGYLYLSGDNKELRFYNGSNYMVLKASGSLSNNYTITLPVDDGTTGQFLKTDGGGVLSWSDVSGAILTDDTVTEAKLDISNGPQNGYYLQTNGSGVLTWAAVAAGGVDTTGTPANNQIATFTDTDTLQGESTLTYVNGSLTINYDSGASIFHLDSSTGQSLVKYQNAGTSKWDVGIDPDSSSNQKSHVDDWCMYNGGTYGVVISGNGSNKFGIGTQAGIATDGAEIPNGGIRTTGQVMINDTSSAGDGSNVPMLTVKLDAANSGEMAAFKWASHSQPVTSYAEADTMFSIRQAGNYAQLGFWGDSGATGGQILAVATTPTPTKSSSTMGAFRIMCSTNNGAATAAMSHHNSENNNNMVTMDDNTSTRFLFGANGIAHADDSWADFSDGRLKFNQAVVPYGLAEVMQLQPKIYDKDSGYIVEEEFTDAEGNVVAVGEIVLEGRLRTNIGFVAQEVKAIIPEIVQDVNDFSWYSLNDGKLMAVVVKAIQELKAEIDALKA